ncbi:flavin reductase [Roseovarius salis]|uniref:flavin reductase family protein n=1 Tax=Roseovarius salis TaxID=3376063 RepID=UPI0037C6B0FB
MFRKMPELVQRDDFIAAMRRVAASVTVVTTDGPAGRAGATVSAFSSVSADPPTVLVCLNAESRIAHFVQENSRFCVNVLPEDSAEIADRFAGRHDDRVADRFAGIKTFAPGGQAPLIDGATAFCCGLQQAVRSGSHLIMVGHVREVLDGRVPPLAYRDGAYHRVVPQTAAAG